MQIIITNDDGEDLAFFRAGYRIAIEHNGETWFIAQAEFRRIIDLMVEPANMTQAIKNLGPLVTEPGVPE